MLFLHPEINNHFLISLNNQSVFTHCFPSGFLQWFCLKLSVGKVYTLHMSYLLNSPLSRAVPRQLLFNTTVLWKVLNWFYRQIICILNWSLCFPIMSFTWFYTCPFQYLVEIESCLKHLDSIQIQLFVRTLDDGFACFPSGGI